MSDRISFYTTRVKKFKNGDLDFLVDNKLYVRGRMFRQWWENPAYELPYGAILSVARHQGKPIGVGLINLYYYNARPRYLWLREQTIFSESTGLPVYPEVQEIGLAGFFVKEDYRKHGVATKLFQLMEKRVMKEFPGLKYPVVFCTPPANNAMKNGKRLFWVNRDNHTENNIKW